MELSGVLTVEAVRVFSWHNFVYTAETTIIQMHSAVLHNITKE